MGRLNANMFVHIRENGDLSPRRARSLQDPYDGSNYVPGGRCKRNMDQRTIAYFLGRDPTAISVSSQQKRSCSGQIGVLPVLWSFMFNPGLRGTLDPVLTTGINYRARTQARYCCC